MTDQAVLIADEPPAPAVEGEPSRNDRWSAWAFGAALVLALPLLLWFGRDQWFFLDDWWVLTRDGLTKPGYLDGHNGHWITLLRLDYRLNFQLWGLRSYLPYQVPVVLAHLAAAALLRVLMCRMGVRGWVATAAALAFLFFGSGRENMVFGFQVSLTTSLVCGLALFLLGDGPRSVTRRDWLTLGVGVVGLMTSGVFPALVIGFGVTTLLRRGVRVAAFFTVPLGIIYLGWYLRYGRDGATPLELTTQTFRFVGRMFWATFDALAQGGVGAVLVAGAALGLGTAVHRAWRTGAWAEAALPLGLAVAWMAFAATTALARANALPEIYKSGRYLHIGAALLLPLVASGAEQLARRWTLVGAVALVPLAIGLPGNIDKLTYTEPILRGNPQLLFAMAHSPFIDDLPPSTRVVRGGPFDVPLTTGWLARQADAGRIPEPDAADPVQGLNATAWLVLVQEHGSAVQPGCPSLTAPLALTLRPSDRVRFAGLVSVTTTDGTHESSPVPFVSDNGSVIRALAGPVDVVVRPAFGRHPQVCGPGPHVQ